MRLSQWLAAPPARDAVNPRVASVVDDVLAVFSADPDPEAWLAWGDDPTIRWTVLVPSVSGLVVAHARVNVPGEGPRASAKLVRWSRVQTGEFAVETQQGHRIVSFQVEGQVLRGADAEADRIGAFAQVIFAAIDGRPAPEPGPARRSRAAPKGAAAKGAAAKGAAAKGAAAKGVSAKGAAAQPSAVAGSATTKPTRAATATSAASGATAKAPVGRRSTAKGSMPADRSLVPTRRSGA